MNNDENKSPLTKRRSNRFKIDTKIAEEKIIGKKKAVVEKEILSDEDVPLSVTKAHLVAETPKDEVCIQPDLSEAGVSVDVTSTAKLNQSSIDKLFENNLVLDREKVELEQESNSKLKETVLVSKKKSRVPKEQPPKRNRTKKQIKTPEHVLLNTKPSIIENEPNIFTNSTENGNISSPIKESDINAVEEQNDSTLRESELLQRIIEDKSIEQTNIIIKNVDTIDETKSTVENTETVNTSNQVKKKRKRRKNELAAIVADQLLESFKEVDKSRIDDLKMLENLAYEKSEDLLLTGEYFLCSNNTTISFAWISEVVDRINEQGLIIVCTFKKNRVVDN